MRNTLLLLFFTMLFYMSNGQNSFIGARYDITDYSALNKVVKNSGYTGFDNNDIQFSFGTSSRKKKTAVGFEIFFGLDKKKEISTGNTNKKSNIGFLFDTRTALNKSKKSVFSIIFNFGFQKSNLVFYNKDKVKTLSAVLDNQDVDVKSFRKNELIGQLGLGYDFIAEAGFGIGIDVGFQAGYGKWKYLDLVNPEFPKSPFGNFFAGLKIYFGKKKHKMPKMKPMDKPTGPMTSVE